MGLNLASVVAEDGVTVNIVRFIRSLLYLFSVVAMGKNWLRLTRG